ncbi:UvrD-helicase domain-containing protein [Castellaniella hirudinis]|uniref:UvrD-helicase domain-containing protein n=1 Tax=Castellaniella hirudinis TaxID=1144617 RepID=UPI0039C30BCC
MTDSPQALPIPEVDPLAFSLPGSHLIEASAGTGKTWTIAALYVRLVLGHGELPALLPGQILVLTFTEAAAQELRDRIRSRLSEAAAGFAAGLTADDPLDDPYLHALRAAYPPAQWAACARLLDLAAQAMDEAAISTIHAWCMRVLKEHAFDSAMLFEQDMLTDLTDLSRELAWDYWRGCVAGLDIAVLPEVLAIWRDPDALARDYGGILTQEGLPEQPEQPLAALCAQALRQRAQALADLKADWRPRIDALAAWVEAHGAGLKRLNDVKRWLQALQDWLAAPDQTWPAMSDTAWAGLSGAGLAARWKDARPRPDLPEAEFALDPLRQALNALPQLASVVRPHALGWLAARLQQAFARRGALGFDGLLSGLAQALEGPQGETLALRLRQQFPVVLVDEFQDTDPVQYRIFDRIYQVAQPGAETALIFIGDPKQAIYRFRGGDVQTYLRAARACRGRVQTLARNYRSARALVQAVNHVFEREDGEPAFPTGLAGQSIAFHPVQARGRDESWCVEGRAPAALVACRIADADKDTIGVEALRARAAQACARAVADLLRQGGQGRAGFASPQGFRPVRAADMAVLVNQRKEAALVREALAAHGVRSVYLSEQGTVFDAPVAQDLGFILAACAHPDDERAIRAALATPLLGLEIARLADLADNEWAWDDQVERFQRYRQRWRWRGVLPMLRQLLHDFSVPARLLAQGAEGERQLTDCLHLAELLQQASGQLDGEDALLHYLARQRDFHLADVDAEGSRRLRLESDEALVRVVTVHKSKGLEYPLVFLPFVSCGLWEKPPAGPQTLQLDGRRQWLLQLDEAQQAQLRAELLGEEVRKLYVALTRARHAVWLALADTGRPSGIAHVLADARARTAARDAPAGVPTGVSAADPAPGAALFAAWAARCRMYPDQFAWAPEDAVAAGPTGVTSTTGTTGVAATVSGPASDSAGGVAAADEADRAADLPALGPARRLAGPLFPRPWGIASYSSLQLREAWPGGPVRAAAPPETAAEDVLREDAPLWAPAPEDGPDDSPAADLADFPRGSQAGTFLHGLLEWAARRGFCHLEDARDMIARRCAVRGWETHIDGLHQWLLTMAATAWRPQLPGAPVFRLADVPACLAEMEFWLPATQVSVAALDRCITDQTFDAASRPALADDCLDGLFKGFIDLTLRLDDGRYYVVDYKSNDLGPTLAHYRPAALRAALCAARYDVQMLMYVLALHRQLRARLPDYAYARHMGGAIYMFLRGREAPGQGLLSLRPPQSLIDTLDALFAGAPEP